MTYLAKASRRWLAGITLGMLASMSAVAGTYTINLFEGVTPAGTGSFAYTNPGNAPLTPPVVVNGLKTNPSSIIGPRTFNDGVVNVQIPLVSFTDNKVPSNKITGFFVEGLIGTLDTTSAEGLSPGICSAPGQSCFYRITFAFVAAPPGTNPATASKTYKVELIVKGGGVVATPVPAGTYAVSNILTIPEPGSLALVLVAGAALAWLSLRRPGRERVLAKV